MSRLKKKFRSIKKLPTWLFWFPAMLLKFLRYSFYRVKIVDPNDYIRQARGMVTVTWHNRLLFFPAVFPKETRKRTVAVVSASRDGQYITDLISFFGLRSLRGSSSRRGAQAQLEAVHAIRDGFHVSFTPDGPRGPRYHMQPGPVHLASKTGASIIPIAINASRYWEITSWDRFQIPKPFSRLTLVLGDAIPVPPSLTKEEFERVRLQVENELKRISQCEDGREEENR